MTGPLQGIARAKINLNLHITGRREDGFHELESLTVFAGFGDVLSAAPADELRLEVSGPQGAGLGADADNLVLKAARALQDWARARGIAAPGAALGLEKQLPVASGIGGGSADAAGTLRLLNRLWALDATDDELLQIAAQLGADVPACVLSRPLIMRGVGEKLTRVSGFPALHMLLVNPGVGVATPQVFKALDWEAGRRGAPLPALPGNASEDRLITWLEATRNDLQAPAMRLQPVIGDVLAALAGAPGCRLARMSGSGATCFGLFDDGAAAHAAQARIAHARPGWWAVAAETGA